MIIDRLLDVMSKKNIKMVELAECLGVNKSVVSAWKSRRTNPPVEYSDRICKLIGVSYEFYLTGEDGSYILEVPASSNDVSSHFSDEEKELIETYNRLDKRGQHKLHTVIYEELDRMNDVAQKPKSKENHAE